MLRGSGCSSASDSQVGKPYLAGLERLRDETDVRALRLGTACGAGGSVRPPPQRVTFELGGSEPPPPSM